MEKNNKTNKFIVLGTLALVFIFMLIASSFNSNTGKTRITDIYYPDANGNILHAQLLIPKGVSAVNPAPAIVNVHGGSDYLLNVGNFTLELSRRGYVVIAVDSYRSGWSHYAMGRPAAGENMINSRKGNNQRKNQDYTFLHYNSPV